MTASEIIFYVLAIFILGTAILSVTTRKIFRSAIWLLFSLMGIAGLYFFLQVEFIAAVQIIVYVGGIVVLLIFSIFLTQQAGKEMARAPLTRMIASIAAVLIGFALSWILIRQHGFQKSGQDFNWTVSKIGTELLSTGNGGYALPLEVISMLLLAAMIGCIVIALKAPATPKPTGESVQKDRPGQEENTEP